MPSSRKKKHSPSNSIPSNGPASQSRATQQRQFPIRSQSQSNSQSPHDQQKQQSQPLYPWSTHTPPSGLSPSPFPLYHHALSTTPTAVGELFLFGGRAHSSKRTKPASNDLYMFSTRDFSTTLLKTSGQAPSPRYGHRAAFTSTILLIWGGVTNFGDQNAAHQCDDDSLYLLNLVSREWTCVVVNGPRPCSRCFHSMTLVGSKLFVFGGMIAGRNFNDIWVFDLNSLVSNPFWELYEPTPGNEKPLPRNGHVSVTTGDRIIIFGGAGPHSYNDTWSFDLSTRKWTELQCTGSIPSPRAGNVAVLVDDVMYVFGGRATGGTKLGDLSALNLSTQRWTAFEDIGPSPCGRMGHAMASDGRRVFVLGGDLSQVDEAKLIHVLDTKLLIYPKPDSNTAKRSEKTIQLAQKLSAGHPSPTQGQPQQRIFSSSDAGAAHGAFAQLTDQLAQKSALLEQAEANAAEAKKHAGLELREQQAKIDELLLSRDQALEQAQSALQKATSRAAEANERSQRELAGVHVKLEARESELEAVRLQLTDQLAQKSALLGQAEANAAETKKHAGLELRELQAKLDESMLSHDEHLCTFEQAQSALHEATSRAADANDRCQRACEQIEEYETKLAEVRAELEEKKSELAVRLQLTDQLAQKSARLERTEANAAEAKKHAGLEQRELQAKLDVLMLSRDAHMRTLEPAQSALQNAASRAADANERSRRECEQTLEYETKLAEVRAELEEKKSELEAVRLQLTDANDGGTKSSAKAENLFAQNTAGPINTDEDQVTRGIMERMRAMEAKIASLQWSEKSFEMMECRNEG